MAPRILAVVVGIPVLAGVLVESWVIASLLGWDAGTLFSVQAVPVCLLAGFAMSLDGTGRD